MCTRNTSLSFKKHWISSSKGNSRTASTPTWVPTRSVTGTWGLLGQGWELKYVCSSQCCHLLCCLPAAQQNLGLAEKRPDCVGLPCALTEVPWRGLLRLKCGCVFLLAKMRRPHLRAQVKDKAIAPSCQDVHVMDFIMPPNFTPCHLAFICRAPKIVQLQALPSEPVTIPDENGILLNMANNCH